MAITRIGSSCIDCVQAHWLLPPPLTWHQPSPPFAANASRQDRSCRYVLCNGLATNLDKVGNAAHAALPQDVHRLWVDPDTIGTPLQSMFPRHPIGGTNVKALKPGQSRAGQVPRLAAVQ